MQIKANWNRNRVNEKKWFIIVFEILDIKEGMGFSFSGRENSKKEMGFSFSGRENSKKRGEAAIQRAWKVIN